MRLDARTTCLPADGKGGIEPVGSLGQTFHSAMGSDSNESIGMPPIEHATHRRGPWWAPEYFNEMRIKADKTIALRMGHAELSHPGAPCVAVTVKTHC